MIRPAPRRPLPGPAISAWRRAIRYWASRLLVTLLVRAWLRVRLDGREQLPDGPAIYCFNHLSWVDPFILMATLPYRPRLFFFGPKEEDMLVGARNRVMHWSGATIPYKPGKNDLLEATRRVAAVIDTGAVIAIAGEGRIGPIESMILPLNDGPAYFALRTRVALVPVAISGTSWLPFGGRVRVRVGEPLVDMDRRPDRTSIAATTTALTSALTGLVADAPELARPGRVGRFVSEVFNDWPEGSRDAALEAVRSGALVDAASAEQPAGVLENARATPEVGPSGL